MQALPYPGYSWPLTQHAAGFREDVLSQMLTCALPFEGQADVGKKISELMALSNILTHNVRDGVIDAWRDYQQILAELGLLYSTKISTKIKLTEMGKSFVSGDIDYRSMMSNQSFRYQYPNGQKHTLQPAQKTELVGTKFEIIPNQVDLHMSAGVMIRPAVLIMRIVYELHKSGDIAPLSADEIAQFLLPIKVNKDWPQALDEIKAARVTSVNQNNDRRRSRRNIQDWLKLLRENAFFDTDGVKNIKLSQFSINNIESIEGMLNIYEDPAEFWIPLSSSIEERVSWFEWFGSVSADIGTVESITTEHDSSEKESDDSSSTTDEDDDAIPNTMPVSLADIDEEALLKKKSFSHNPDMDKLAKSVAAGAMKRHAKALLHDEIVVEYARKFRSQGAKVVSDINSVDLLVLWNEYSALFEVKTVNAKNIQGRLRLALGQVEEYSYRLRKEHNINADKGIIINRPISHISWQADFFANHMKVGIISRTSKGSTVIKPQNCQSCKEWS